VIAVLGDRGGEAAEDALSGCVRTLGEVGANGRTGQRRQARAPMLATLGRPPAGDEFAVEVKYDGQRGLIVVDDDGLAVFTRNGADVRDVP